MDVLSNNWELVVNFGPPIIAVLVGLLAFSSIFYALECKNLSEMEKELKSKGNLNAFEYAGISFVDPFLLFYIFKFIPNPSSNFFIDPKFEAQVKSIKSYRKFYKIAIPIIVIITAIGIMLNALIADK